MRTHCTPADLPKHGRRLVRARFDGGPMSSDGGALLLRGTDRRSHMRTDRTDQSVPEQVAMQGRESRMRAFLQTRGRNQRRVSSRQPVFEVRDAKTQSSPRVVTYAGKSFSARYKAGSETPKAFRRRLSSAIRSAVTFSMPGCP